MLALHLPLFLPSELLCRFVSTDSMDASIPKSPQQLWIAAELGWWLSVLSCFRIFPPILNLHFFCSTTLARTSCSCCDGRGAPLSWSPCQMSQLLFNLANLIAQLKDAADPELFHRSHQLATLPQSSHHCLSTLDTIPP